MREIKFICIFVLLLLASACAVKFDKGDLFLVNNSQEQIESIRIKVCANSLEVRDMQLNDKVKVSYEITSDCNFNVFVLFKSGRKIEKEVGYITHGFSYEHEISITDSDIVLVSTKVKT